MMNQSTISNEGASPLISHAEFIEAREAQRLLLIDLLTPCDYGTDHPNHPNEPHAYHSDDTADDLNAALEIYHALFDMTLQSPDQVIEDLTRWLTDLVIEAQSYELPEDPDDDEPLPPFACDGVSGPLQTLYTRIYKARKAQG